MDKGGTAMRMLLALLVCGSCGMLEAKAVEPPRFATVSDWRISVERGGQRAEFSVSPPAVRHVTDEPMSLPPFAPDQWLLAKGKSPKRVISDGTCSTRYALDDRSVRMRLRDGTLLERGRDWDMEPEWARFGYLKGGRVVPGKAEVLVSYDYRMMRVDAIVCRKVGGSIEFRTGVDHIASPERPFVSGDEELLGTVFVEPSMRRLDDEHLFPKTEDAPAFVATGAFRRFCPKTYEKLTTGKPVRIMAWGDSVTDLKYLGRGGRRWQNRFVKRLEKIYPQSRIELVTVAWGGHTSVDFLNAPATDREHHFATAVLGARPDLVVSEFVNDGFVAGPKMDAIYGGILRDFRSIGAEWIICTPHYVRPDHMGAKNLKTDNDPRWNTISIREFCRTNGLACADAALRWGHLWREGEPYLPLLVNNLNHPDERGVSFYADALVALLPEEDFVAKKIFEAAFDGTAVAVSTGGAACQPLVARDLEWTQGRRGKALRMRNGTSAALAYSAEGNVFPKQGSVSFWFNPDGANFTGPYDAGRMFFSTPRPEKRPGSGTLWFWKYGQLLRADQSDDGDSYVTAPAQFVSNAWNHIAYTWDIDSTHIFLNGEDVTPGRLSCDQIRSALKSAASEDDLSFSGRRDFPSFYIGCSPDGRRMDGAMDDLAIWSRPLSGDEVRKLCPPSERPKAQPDVCRDIPAKSYGEKPHGGGGDPGPLELVDRVVLDGHELQNGRFASVGDWHVGEVDGRKYMESSGRAHDRIALRFSLDTSYPLYFFEIDYPDDGKRTMDFVVQGSRETRWDGEPGADYVLQSGVACGGEYANSGRMLTHRCHYWQRGGDVTLSVMTLRGGAPAAVGEVRVFRVKSGRMPCAAVAEPPANEDGWRRTFALYYEDPAAGYDFGVDGTDLGLLREQIARLAASMKYVGQNVLCYPGAWYDGLIDGEKYNPRWHAHDYREAYYDTFDREGLGFMPTLNWIDMTLPAGTLTRAKLEDGTFLETPVSAFDDGGVNFLCTHGQPPDVNIAHPMAREIVEKAFGRLVEEGRRHPSFRGIVLHLSRHSLLWFGDICAGYNDYCIRQFATERHVDVPAFSGAGRGMECAKWIRANCMDEWIDWRCGVVADFYRRLAKRLSDARPDLKLVVNSFLLPQCRDEAFGSESFIPEQSRLAGLDVRKLADVPNVSICQTQIPADYRWFAPYDPTNPKDNGRWREHRARAEPLHRSLYLKRGDFGQVLDAVFPWVNQHDRYWESAIGKTSAGNARESLSREWLLECPWRCSTVNPAGRHALRAYSAPLRHCDVLAVSKGGFLVGTYGTEDVLVPWIRAFRALPAVRMKEFFREGDVVGRFCNFRGKTYCYVVNAGDSECTVEVPLPGGSVDLVGGGRVNPCNKAKRCRIVLQPYELRSYADDNERRSCR